MFQSTLRHVLIALFVCMTQVMFGIPDTGWTAYNSYNAGGEEETNPSLLPIQTATQTPSSAIGLDRLGLANYDVVISPDAQTAYVCLSNTDTESAIRIVAIPTGQLGDVIILPDICFSLAITPDGKWLYVSGYTTNQVFQINLDSKTIAQTIVVGSNPWGIAITRDGKRAFIANSGGQNVTVLNIENPAAPVLVTTISVGTNPQNITLTPDSGRAYVSNFAETTISRIDNVEIPVVGNTITLAGHPCWTAISSDGTMAYITQQGEGDVVGIVPLPLATEVPGDLISVASLPYEIALTPDGKTAFAIANNENQIIGITLETKAVNYISLPSPGSGPWGIAITPDQAPTARFAVQIAHPGEPSSFDASESTSPIGSIARYDWTFGDGSTVSTTSPTITHIYRRAGAFSVTLQVTNTAGTSLDQISFGRMTSNNGGPSAETTHKVHIRPERPTHFVGTIHSRDRKHQFSLHTTWKPSETRHIARYEIFIHHQHTRIASVSSRSELKKHIPFHAHSRKKEDISRHVIHALERKYQIRAVSDSGEDSYFLHLHVKKD